MTKKETHVQVNLVKNSVRYTCWIPSENVKLGSIVELEDRDHKGQKYFDDGWEVVGLGREMPSDYVRERERDRKTLTSIKPRKE